MNIGKCKKCRGPLSALANAVRPDEQFCMNVFECDLAFKYSTRENMENMTVLKDTNPKDAVGIKKPPMSTIPSPVLMLVGLAMLEGARKYGRHNYRISKVRYSVYYDAVMRHMMQAWEGEDVDPDSGLPHVIKAIASLVVLADAMQQNKLVDDRPPSTKTGWLRDMQPVVDGLFEKYPVAKEAFIKEQPLLSQMEAAFGLDDWDKLYRDYQESLKDEDSIGNR